jgi:molybdopterin molybdotransferase
MFKNIAKNILIMLEYEEAINLILNEVNELEEIKLNISDSLGYVTSRKVFAKIDLPPFDNSAVDGYAVKSEDVANASKDNAVKLKIVGKIAAGDYADFEIKNGEAVKVMTGAMLPKGADAVCMVEFTKKENGYVEIYSKVKKWENVRFKGEEIKEGEVALEEKTFITPSIVGLLAKLGYNEVFVYRKPKVALIVTGKELVCPGNELEKGKIWDANSFSLEASLKLDGFECKNLSLVGDDKNLFENLVKEAVKNFDVILVSGGTSEGEEDFVREVFDKIGVRKVFWKIAIKPGKPIFFGKLNKSLLFALPGNPASAMVCYYEFVRPALLKMSGRKDIFLPKVKARLIGEIKRKPGRREFIRAISFWNGNEYVVKSAGMQESYVLKSFAEANCFIVIDKEKEVCKENELVEVELLPWFLK